MFKSPNSRVSPQAIGVRLNSSISAQALPILVGRTQAAPKIIWKGPVKSGSGGKKSKAAKKGGGISTTTADLDMLLAAPGFGRTRADQITSQPLQSIFAVWSNKDKWSVNFGTWTGVVASGAVTITYPGTLVTVFAMTVTLPYSATFNDYGGFGSATYSGNFQKPLWNSQFHYYDELSLTPHGGSSRTPYVYTQSPTTAGGATISVDPGLNGKTVTVYFAYIGGGAGAVSETKLYVGGSGYAIGDTGFINSGNSNANYVVTSVDANGAVTGFSMTSFGSGYTTGTGLPTATGGAQPGSGSGLAITIKSITKASKLPLTQVKQAFEPFLGNSGVTGQPTTYDDVGGVAGANVDLGAGNMAPNFKYETLSWGSSPEGDANPADLFALLIMAPHALNMQSFLQIIGAPGILGSLAGMRNYCDAYGIWISAYIDQQSDAHQVLNDLLDIANCAAVWSEGLLKPINYSEVSKVGNGAEFTAPTAAGPQWTILPSDFIADKGVAPLKIERTSQADAKNILPLEFTDRSNDYAPNQVAIPEGQSMSEFGARRDTTRTLRYIHDADKARTVGGPIVRRAAQTSRGTYKGKLRPAFVGMEAMDLAVITEPITGLNGAPARILKATVNADNSVEFEAEPYSYGANAPTTLDGETAKPGTVYTNLDPGSCGTPVFIEPVPRLYGGGPAELWIAVPSSSTTYGGCEILVSVNGGSSYQSLGRLFGNSTVGVTTANFPAAADPDTTNDLPVDLSQSLGVLDGWPASAADSFVSVAYLAGGMGSIPYELIAYTGIVPTSANHYTLKATGAGNEIRRAVYSAPQVGSGILHASGAKFVDLNGPLFKVTLDPKWIGKTLYFKPCAFNIFQNQEQDPSTVTPVTYTPTGVAQALQGNGSYTIAPAQPLSQAASTYVVAMAQSTATFAGTGLSTNYNARNFTVADPGAGNTQQYWVTIYDPGQVGDTGSGTTLNAYCDTNQTKWNTPGYIRIGTIVVTHAGTVSGGGGGSSSSVLNLLTINESPDGSRVSFSLNTNVSLLIVFIDGQKVNSADISGLPGSSFTLGFAPATGSKMEALGG